MDNSETFFKVYREQLDIGIDPKWLEAILQKMKTMILAGTADLEGLALQQTCEILKIKPTYKSINDYLRGVSK